MSTVLTWVSATLLTAAALLIVVRIVRGPTVLDRVVALDVLIAVIVSALALEAVVNRHGTTLPILITLSLLGFLSSVTVARYVERDSSEVAEDDDVEEGRG
ncbi:MAG TPA: monovalent cation/H+ antiporter complex subunit F [Actinomycetales bacterium]|nr:monovalent cation/H+ antiporter complex subunit F [Actinomycetales bacterium]